MERQLQEARRSEREAVRAFIEAKAERDRFAGEEEKNRAVWFRAATSDRLGGDDAAQVSAVAASTIAEMERLAEERIAEVEALCAAKISAADADAAQRMAEMEAATAEAIKSVEALAAERLAAQAEQARARPTALVAGAAARERGLADSPLGTLSKMELTADPTPCPFRHPRWLSPRRPPPTWLRSSRRRRTPSTPRTRTRRAGGHASLFPHGPASTRGLRLFSSLAPRPERPRPGPARRAWPRG